MKLVFIDLDGVLNSDFFFQYKKETTNIKFQNEDIDPIALSLLHWIFEKTSCFGVVSASCRFSYDIDELNNMLFPGWDDSPIIGKTPSIIHKIAIETIHTNEDQAPRGCEIDNYIRTCQHQIEDYIILDDDSDMLLKQHPHFYQCDSWCGLTNNIAHKVINHLNRS